MRSIREDETQSVMQNLWAKNCDLKFAPRFCTNIQIILSHLNGHKYVYFFSEPSVPQVEPQELFDSLIKTYEKLKELGFTYYNGKVSVIESKEEDSNV